MSRLHLAVALDGTGWHPASWREPDARPDQLFTAGYWTGLVRTAESGKLDFVTIADALHLDREPGRLDAVLIASRVAPLTRNIGLVPVAVVTHTEPFHLSKAIATLDYVSKGRAGIAVQVSTSVEENRHFGRREFPIAEADLVAEAADYVEVLRRLWDSWEDDAEIRDVATGRFVDRDKLHYIDFTGKWFSVKGPSITPRPPQGQPIVAAEEPVGEDVRFTDAPGDLNFRDVVVFLDTTETEARARKARLDARASAPEGFVGTPEALADQLIAWQNEGHTGFRLWPGVLPHDLNAIVDGLVPILQERGVFRTEYEAPALRGLLGLDRPKNRYAA
ncbi:LLM class flavin-dependent oxidoreductase [Actinocrispum sp. NPDC049592]|uniref:LLM class flavin-dependent oxidoreductase n=1 Tax=Actinocrispum sp. NPDC049592 TaxID=3154835 RepID=UPI0034193EEC